MTLVNSFRCNIMLYHGIIAHLLYPVSNRKLRYFQVFAIVDSTTVNSLEYNLYYTSTKDSRMWTIGVELLSLQICDTQC